MTLLENSVVRSLRLRDAHRCHPRDTKGGVWNMFCPLPESTILGGK